MSATPLAITMGDPSGVGPEIVLRRWCEGDLGDDVVVYGDLAILRHGASLLGLDVDWDAFPVVDLGLLTAADHRPGQLDAASGAAARAYVERATLDALAISAGAGAVKVDGDLSDAVWTQAPSVSEFRQRDPHEGAPATHATAVQVVFDSTALYVAVRATEPDPRTLVGLLTRRDDVSPSDWLSVLIDSFHDRRTAFEFGVNVAGVKYDRYWYNDTNSDDSWDAVWDVATRRTAEGWDAEYRIPFSQLRFRAGRADALGFATMRTIAHLQETSTWPLLAHSASGFATGNPVLWSAEITRYSRSTACAEGRSLPGGLRRSA